MSDNAAIKPLCPACGTHSIPSVKFEAHYWRDPGDFEG